MIDNIYYYILNYVKNDGKYKILENEEVITQEMEITPTSSTTQQHQIMLVNKLILINTNTLL